MHSSKDNFSKDEQVRFSRQTILPAIGIQGQARLKQARVLFVGAGGLGSAPAIYLAAAGVGTIGLADGDAVELSNLHRQILHNTADIGKPKVISAREKLQAINPNVQVIPLQERITAQNALGILADYDLVIDGTDNLPSRYLINDACFFLKKPFIFAGVYQFEGQCSIFGPGGPCYRCFFREMPPPEDMPSCAEAGVVGVVPGLLGMLQANEAIKLICGFGESLLGRLLIVDASTARFREVTIKKDPNCPLCGTHPTIREVKEYAFACAAPQPASPQTPEFAGEITVRELKQLMDKDPELYILDVREEQEWDTARIEGAHLIPLSRLEDDYGDIPRDRPVYCLCKVGGRSAHAAQFLKAQGYTRVANIQGGISAWSREIDPSVPQY